MSDDTSRMNRRLFLGGLTLGAAALWVPGAFAEQLLRTPPLTEGPFYPDKLPLDTDNDLIIIGNSLTPAVGQITHLTGRVLNTNGDPLKDLTVEIWQCDARAVYLNTRDSIPKAAQRDKNFQGFGRFATGSKGEYYFRTIKPVPYPGRPAPHIHFKVKKGDRELLTTQLFVRGYRGNRMDAVFMDIRDPRDQALVQADFKAVPQSQVGELAARFDIILGRTPGDPGQSA